MFPAEPVWDHSLIFLFLSSISAPSGKLPSSLVTTIEDVLLLFNGEGGDGPVLPSSFVCRATIRCKQMQTERERTAVEVERAFDGLGGEHNGRGLGNHTE